MLGLLKYGLTGPLSASDRLKMPLKPDPNPHPAEVYSSLLTAQVAAITKIIDDTKADEAKIQGEGGLFPTERRKRIDSLREKAVAGVAGAVYEGEKNLLTDGKTPSATPEQIKSIQAAKTVIQFNIARAKALITGGTSRY